jgi:hypothetical protein
MTGRDTECDELALAHELKEAPFAGGFARAHRGFAPPRSKLDRQTVKRRKAFYRHASSSI